MTQQNDAADVSRALSISMLTRQQLMAFIIQLEYTVMRVQNMTQQNDTQMLLSHYQRFHADAATINGDVLPSIENKHEYDVLLLPWCRNCTFAMLSLEIYNPTHAAVQYIRYVAPFVFQRASPRFFLHNNNNRSSSKQRCL